MLRVGTATGGQHGLGLIGTEDNALTANRFHDPLLVGRWTTATVKLLVQERYRLWRHRQGA